MALQPYRAPQELALLPFVDWAYERIPRWYQSARDYVRSNQAARRAREAAYDSHTARELGTTRPSRSRSHYPQRMVYRRRYRRRYRPRVRRRVARYKRRKFARRSRRGQGVTKRKWGLPIAHQRIREYAFLPSRAIEQNHYAAQNVWDPEYIAITTYQPISGYTPLGYTEMANQYDQYQVMDFRVAVRIENQSAVDTWIAYTFTDTNVTPISTNMAADGSRPTDLMENSRWRVKLLRANTTDDPKTVCWLRPYKKMVSMFPEYFKDPFTYGSAVGSNPSRKMYLWILMGSSAAAGFNVNLNWKIDQKVKFYERKTMDHT